MLRLVLGWLPRIPHPLSPSKEPNLAAPCQGPQQHLPQGRWHQRMLELLPLQEASQGTRAPDKSSFLKLYEDAVTSVGLQKCDKMVIFLQMVLRVTRLMLT